MGRKRVIDVVQDDMDAMKRLMNCGIIDIARLSDYKVYVFYSTLNKIESKMDKYSFTAEAMGLSETHVRKIISKMEKEVII